MNVICDPAILQMALDPSQWGDFLFFYFIYLLCPLFVLMHEAIMLNLLSSMRQIM